MLLKQTVNKCLAKFYDVCKRMNDVNVLQKYEVTGLRGKLELQCGPWWCFVLADESYKLACVLMDRSRSVVNLCRLCGCLVEVSKAFIVVECYQTRSIQLHVSLVFTALDVTLLERFSLSSWVTPFYGVIPLHVIHITAPVVLNECAICLVLVAIGGRYVWMLLKDKQVFWHSFLVPNRRYVLHTIESCDYFEKNGKPMRAVLGKFKGIPVFREILHHPELWPTMNTVELPDMSSLSIVSSISAGVEYSESACWRSIDEAVAFNKSQIVSLYGEVVVIKHQNLDERDGCSLCVKMKRTSKDPTNMPDCVTDKQTWLNPWESCCKLESDVDLPDLFGCDNVVTGVFLPEKLIKIVHLRDVYSGNTISLYVKKRSRHQYQSVFMLGSIICGTFLQRRLSAKGGYVYFTSTALSTFELLNYNDVNHNFAASVVCGFPYQIVPHGTMSWGLLDMWTLLSVELAFKKSHDGDNRFSATALLSVPRHTGYVTVYMMNDRVKELLQLPDEVWRDLATASEVVALSYKVGCSVKERSSLSGMFNAFCALRNRIKTPFNIACRLFPPKPNYSDFYFCTSIEYTNPRRYCDLLKEHLVNK